MCPPCIEGEQTLGAVSVNGSLHLTHTSPPPIPGLLAGIEEELRKACATFCDGGVQNLHEGCQSNRRRNQPWFDLGFHCVLLSTSAVIYFLPVVFVYLRMTMQTPSHLSLCSPVGGSSFRD